MEYVVVPAGPSNPSTRTTQRPAAGFAIVTDSSESPSAFCPASTQVPVVQIEDEQVEIRAIRRSCSAWNQYVLLLAAMHAQIDQLAYAHTSFFTTEVGRGAGRPADRAPRRRA